MFKKQKEEDILYLLITNKIFFYKMGEKVQKQWKVTNLTVAT
jgi:hypothetical protein